MKKGAGLLEIKVDVHSETTKLFNLRVVSQPALHFASKIKRVTAGGIVVSRNFIELTSEQLEIADLLLLMFSGTLRLRNSGVFRALCRKINRFSGDRRMG